MKQYYAGTSRCFDDILLVPRSSDISTRSAVGLEMNIGYRNPVKLDFPVIASPMDTVCEHEMAQAMADAGGLGVIHRYMSISRRIKSFKKVKGQCAVAIGATGDYFEEAVALYEAGCRIILVDTANGHNVLAEMAVAKLRREFNDLHIMAGNISTWDAFLSLSKAGADSIRVGIGGGSCCTTRIVTGHGMPTLASVMEIKEAKDLSWLPTSIIADGGIRNSGDMVKSFAAGADAVMVGSILAGTDESPGIVHESENGLLYKEFRGMASREAQEHGRGKVSVAEGISTTVKYKGSADKILKDIRGGISSGCSYSGAVKLSELHDLAEYIDVSHASVDESRPHAN